MESIDTGETDCDTCLIMQEILSDEIEDEEFLAFAIVNHSELFGYIASGRINIRIPGILRVICGLGWGKRRFLFLSN